MKTKWKVALAVGAVVLLAGAAADINRHFPGGITLSGNSHVYTDSGTELQRDGVAVGGGGDTIWTNVAGNIQTASTNSVQIVGENGGYYYGSWAAIGHNYNPTPNPGDVLIAEQNGDDGPTPKMFVDVTNAKEASFDDWAQMTLGVTTNTINIDWATSSSTTSQAGTSIFASVDPLSARNAYILVLNSSGATVILEEGTIRTTRTNRWGFGKQTAPAGTTNLTIQVDGQWYQFIAVPVSAP